VEVKKGIPVSAGFVVGEAFVMDAEEVRISRHFIDSSQAQAEIARFEDSLAKASTEIETLQNEAAATIGSEFTSIFDFHKAILADKQLRKEVKDKIVNNKFTAEYAVSQILRKHAKSMASMENEVFKQRVADIYDIERRILRNLLGARYEQLKSMADEVIVIASDLTPSQTASLDKTKVKGFATDAGGRTSHTAIVARAVGIPAVVGVGTLTSDVSGGDIVVIDGTNGLVIINPDERTLAKYRALEADFISFKTRLAEVKDLPAETIDGAEVEIYANIGFPEEVESALSAGARGIGLYRTEFLFTGESVRYDEESQFRAYMDVVRKMGDMPVVIRTLDLGADKAPESLSQHPEANPFLGCRSIRYCLEKVDVFKTQFRAILRASAFGNIKIMLPMISSVEEVRRTKQVLADAMDELRERDLSFNEKVSLGIMIEAPSAALTADILAKEVDFFSIGTNDLIQYSLAVDRGNERVAPLYQPAHPAILRLVKQVIDTGHTYRIPVAMCGEMSAEVLYTILLLGIGLRAFSVTPVNIREVKKVIRSVTMKEAVEVANTALELTESKTTESFLREKTHRIVPQLA
jgi:phosphotransferase system enzyme I (PtsI)